ncbi:uncharacterized protein LOC119333519 [Triticum dicoccoides]|uniref:uncharacterized protein LOC119333519 n=1 Tax=Triticum dicoccoides TaxID=85692 RepID=UPI0018917859|nr:uncharacterized protein LOC119333519 [Triticum dicoccoides]
MYLPSTSYTAYYAGGDTANVPWQASQIAGGARHFGVTDHTRWPNAAQQEPTTTVNSGAGTSTAGSSERTEDAFHQPADCHAANNFESESGMAIIPAMPTSTPLNTSTSNTRVDGTAADTEANDETDDDAQEDEDGGQSEIVVPQPPYIGQRFGSFAEAKEYHQRLPDESIREYWTRFLSVKDKISDYLDSDIVSAFQRRCKDKGVSNALARCFVQMLPKLSELVSRFCTIEDSWLTEENTDSICEDYLGHLNQQLGVGLGNGTLRVNDLGRRNPPATLGRLWTAL